MDVVLLGSGPSSSVPSIRCLLTPIRDAHSDHAHQVCTVCDEAHRNPLSKNRRLNPTLLLRDRRHSKDEPVDILIDCGKTFRESALRFFPTLGVSEIQSLILTHGHADACLGMDDLREVQPKHSKDGTPVHCSAFTKKEIGKRFDYLVPKPPSRGEQKKLIRWVAQLAFNVFEPYEPFVVKGGLKLTPFPVSHGNDYTSYGFDFGQEVGVRLVYISDVSELPSEATSFLTNGQEIDILILDALTIERFHPTHLNLPKAISIIRQLRPKRSILTGMGHSFDYYSPPPELQDLESEGLHVEMGFDGLELSFPQSNEVE